MAESYVPNASHLGLTESWAILAPFEPRFDPGRGRRGSISVMTTAAICRQVCALDGIGASAKLSLRLRRRTGVVHRSQQESREMSKTMRLTATVFSAIVG